MTRLHAPAIAAGLLLVAAAAANAADQTITVKDVRSSDGKTDKSIAFSLIH